MSSDFTQASPTIKSFREAAQSFVSQLKAINGVTVSEKFNPPEHFASGTVPGIYTVDAVRSDGDVVTPPRMVIACDEDGSLVVMAGAGGSIDEKFRTSLKGLFGGMKPQKIAKEEGRIVKMALQTFNML